MNTDDYLLGMKDCKEGRPARQGMGEDYNRGYATEYQHEQNMTWESEHGYFEVSRTFNH